MSKPSIDNPWGTRPMPPMLTPEVLILLSEINIQREEILRAFVAKYGAQPDEIVQIRQRTKDGELYYVRRIGNVCPKCMAVLITPQGKEDEASH